MATSESSSCIDEFPASASLDRHGLPPLNIVICIACVVLDTVGWTYAWSTTRCGARPPPRRTTTRVEPTTATADVAPRYGLGGQHVVRMLAVLGLLLSSPQIAMWLAFRHHIPEFACQAQYGAFGVPVFPLLFVVMQALLVTFNAARVNLRHSLVRRLDLRPLLAHRAGGASGDGVVDANSTGGTTPSGSAFEAVYPAPRFLVLQGYRAVYATALGARIQDTVAALGISGAAAAAGPRAHVICADAYSRPGQPENDEWALENCVREGFRVSRLEPTPVAQQFERALRSSSAIGGDSGSGGGARRDVRMHVCSIGGYWRLPFPTGSIDGVLCPFLMEMPHLHSESEPEELRRRKLRALLGEVARVLRPGGVLWANNIAYKARAFTEAVAKVPSFEGHTVMENGCLCLTMIPAFLTTAVAQAPEAAARPGATRLATAPASSTAADPSGVAGSESYGATAHDSDAAVSSEHAGHGLRAHDAHELFRAACVGLLLAFNVGCGIAAAVWWADLLVPTDMPWTAQVANTVVNSIWVFPLSLYYCHGELSGLAAERALSRCDVLRHFGRIAAATLLGLTLYNAVLWLPTFLVDQAIVHRVSPDTLTAVNGVFGVAVWFFAMWLGSVCLRWRRRRAKRGYGAKARSAGDASEALLADRV